MKVDLSLPGFCLVNNNLLCSPDLDTPMPVGKNGTLWLLALTPASPDSAVVELLAA